jgi:hypothetical protein
MVRAGLHPPYDPEANRIAWLWRSLRVLNLHSRDTPVTCRVGRHGAGLAPCACTSDWHRHEFLHPMAKPLGLDDLQTRIETVLHGVPKGSSAPFPIHPNLCGNRGSVRPP